MWAVRAKDQDRPLSVALVGGKVSVLTCLKSISRVVVFGGVYVPGGRQVGGEVGEVARQT